MNIRHVKLLLPFLAFILTINCRNGFIYYPVKEIGKTPADIGLKYEKVSFKSADGISIYGWLVPSDKQRGIILYCHGNGGNISYYLDIIPLFNMIGFSVLMFDYRGYGESEGHPTEEGTYLDAEAAWNFLTIERGIHSSRIIIWGRSLGGSIAAWLAQNRIPAMLVIESSFNKLSDVAGYHSFYAAGFIYRDLYQSTNYIKNVKCPVVVFHSPQDELVPFELGEKLFQNANEPKEFITISGSHNEGFIQFFYNRNYILDNIISKYYKK